MTEQIAEFDTPFEAARVQLGLSPTDYAKALGMNRQYVFDLRSGRRPLSVGAALKLEKLTKRSGYVELAVERFR